MELYSFKNADQYYNHQCLENKRKLKNTWVKSEEIKILSEYISKHVPEIQFGLCHGVRHGREVRLFREFLKVPTIGTEISPTSAYFKYVIQWDFHNIKSQWINRAGFIYTNSFDHSYNPEYCLDQWMKCLKPDGLCIIQWAIVSSTQGRHLSASDCFLADKEEYEAMFSRKYHIKEILSFETQQTRKKGQMYWFVIQHRKS